MAPDDLDVNPGEFTLSTLRGGQSAGNRPKRSRRIEESGRGSNSRSTSKSAAHSPKKRHQRSAHQGLASKQSLVERQSRQLPAQDTRSHEKTTQLSQDRADREILPKSDQAATSDRSPRKHSSSEARDRRRNREGNRLKKDLDGQSRRSLRTTEEQLHRNLDLRNGGNKAGKLSGKSRNLKNEDFRRNSRQGRLSRGELGRGVRGKMAPRNGVEDKAKETRPPMPRKDAEHSSGINSRTNGRRQSEEKEGSEEGGGDQGTLVGDMEGFDSDVDDPGLRRLTKPNDLRRNPNSQLDVFRCATPAIDFIRRTGYIKAGKATEERISREMRPNGSLGYWEAGGLREELPASTRVTMLEVARMVEDTSQGDLEGGYEGFINKHLVAMKPRERAVMKQALKDEHQWFKQNFFV